MNEIIDTPEPMTPTGNTEASLQAVPDASGPTVTGERYRTDVTSLTERIAIRMAGEGAEHAVAAAVAIAVRGMSRLEPREYADTLGIAPADLRALEAGTVPLADLPASLWRLIHEHDLEPVMLVDLDQQLRSDA